MDPRDNPYTPNAGARPPLLVGRDDQLATFDVLLARLTRGFTEQSMIITGLRGVGKTVLLGEFRAKAEEAGWVAVEAEPPLPQIKTWFPFFQAWTRISTTR